MKVGEISKRWFEFAEKDIRNAKILFENKSYEGCIWHCHQAMEKFLKGAVARNGKAIRKTHDLPVLLNDTGLNWPKSILDFTEELNAYYQPVRYPDSAFTHPLKYSRKTADNFLKLTETTIKWLKFQTKQNK